MPPTWQKPVKLRDLVLLLSLLDAAGAASPSVSESTFEIRPFKVFSQSDASPTKYYVLLAHATFDQPVRFSNSSTSVRDLFRSGAMSSTALQTVNSVVSALTCRRHLSLNHSFSLNMDGGQDTAFSWSFSQLQLDLHDSENEVVWMTVLDSMGVSHMASLLQDDQPWICYLTLKQSGNTLTNAMGVPVHHIVPLNFTGISSSVQYMQPLGHLLSTCQAAQRWSKNKRKRWIHTQRIPLTPLNNPSNSKQKDLALEKTSSRRGRKADRRKDHRQAERDIMEGVEGSSCLAVMETDLAAATAAIGNEVQLKVLAEGTDQMLTGFISAVINILIQPLNDDVGNRASPSFIAILTDVICLVLAMPICLGLSHAFINMIAQVLCNLLAEALHYKWTRKILSSMVHTTATEIKNMMINCVLRWLRVEMVPTVTWEIGNFVIGSIPGALSETVSEAVSNIVSPTIAYSLTKPTIIYYYCIYCYYYGDYQYCFYNNDMQWLGDKWWLGSEGDAYD